MKIQLILNQVQVNGFEALGCSEAYGSGLPSDKDDAFAFYLTLLNLFQDLLQAAPDKLLVNFGKFSCQDQSPCWQNLRQ